MCQCDISTTSARDTQMKPTAHWTVLNFISNIINDIDRDQKVKESAFSHVQKSGEIRSFTAGSSCQFEIGS
jgi:hypothetical protein